MVLGCSKPRALITIFDGWTFCPALVLSLYPATSRIGALARRVSTTLPRVVRPPWQRSNAAAVGLVALVGIASATAAEAQGTHGAVRVDYEAPAECPDARSFETVRGSGVGGTRW